MGLQQFWNIIETSLTFTLASNTGINEYDILDIMYFSKNTLVPIDTHPEHKVYAVVYNQLSRILRDHLLENDTINSKHTPLTYNTFVRYKIEKDKFTIM